MLAALSVALIPSMPSAQPRDPAQKELNGPLPLSPSLYHHPTLAFQPHRFSGLTMAKGKTSSSAPEVKKRPLKGTKGTTRTYAELVDVRPLPPDSSSQANDPLECRKPSRRPTTSEPPVARNLRCHADDAAPPQEGHVAPSNQELPP